MMFPNLIQQGIGLTAAAGTDIEAVLDHSFPNKVAAKITNTKDALLAKWLHDGLIRCSEPAPGGTGHRNLYTFEDCVRILVWKALAIQGYSKAHAARLAFQSAKESEFGTMLSALIFHAGASWIQYQTSTALMNPPPAPAFLAFFWEKDGRLVAIHLSGPDAFRRLYQGLEGVEKLDLINVTPLVDRVMTAFEREGEIVRREWRGTLAFHPRRRD